MTFRARLALRISLLVALAGLVGATALLGMAGARHHFDDAQSQYRQLRAVYEVGHRAALARAILQSGSDVSSLRQQAWRDSLDRAALDHLDADGRLRGLIARIDRALVESSSVNPQASGELDAVLGEIATLAGTIQNGIVENRISATRRFGLTIAGVAFLVLLTIGAGIWIGLAQYRSVMRPLRRLRAGVDALARGDLSARLDQDGDAEFRVLIEHFNEMGERLHRLTTAMEGEVEQASRELIRAERLASVGVLAAGVAHEINNPLAIIAGHAQATLRRLDRANGEASALSGEVKQSLSIINEEVFRSRAITDQLLDLAGPHQAEPEPVDLNENARRAVALVEAHPHRAGRSIQMVDADQPCIVSGGEAELLQVVINLLVNALDATSPEGGEVSLRCWAEQGRALLIVEDNGRGLTEEELERAFEPFWSSKGADAPAGRGLGLAVSHAIARRHGGRLEARSEGRGCGSTLRLDLPLAPNNVADS